MDFSQFNQFENQAIKDSISPEQSKSISEGKINDGKGDINNSTIKDQESISRSLLPDENEILKTQKEIEIPSYAKSEIPSNLKIGDAGDDYLKKEMPENKKYSEFKNPVELEKNVPIKTSDGRVIADVSKEEAVIYEKEKLNPAIVNDKDVLIRGDINLDAKDALGRTNRERMEKGLPPVDDKGNAIQLHHVGQKKDGVLAELSYDTHKDNNSVLHPKRDGSEVDHSSEWAKTRSDHWKARLEQMEALQK